MFFICIFISLTILLLFVLLQEENDLLRCQLEAMRNEIRSELTDSSYNCEGHEQQIQVLKETIRNLQTKWLQFNIPENLKNVQTVGQFERHLKHQAASVNDLLSKNLPRKRSMHTLRAHTDNLAQIDVLDLQQPECSLLDQSSGGAQQAQRYKENSKVVPIIDIDIDKSDDEEVKIVEEESIEKNEKQTVKRRSSINFIKENNITRNTVNCENNDIKNDDLVQVNRTSVSISDVPSDTKSPTLEKVNFYNIKRTFLNKNGNVIAFIFYYRQ